MVDGEGKALSALEEPTIRGIVGQIVYERLKQFEDIFPREYSHNARQTEKIEENKDMRRIPLLEVVERMSNPNKEWVLVVSAADMSDRGG